jgi:hypothetical protein
MPPDDRAGELPPARAIQSAGMKSNPISTRPQTKVEAKASESGSAITFR